MRSLPRVLAAAFFAALLSAGPGTAAAAPIGTSYLWHMHQPVYWPDRSTSNPATYEFAFETITRGHSRSDVFGIFNSDDRVHDYQDYPKTALQSVLDLPDAGAQVSFAGALIQNVKSLGDAGWNGGRYAANWYQPYRDAMGWTTSGGHRRLEPVLVGMHHAINPLCDARVFRRELQAQKSIAPLAWGTQPPSTGFFPAEMCFSERLIPALAAEGVQWAIVPDVHVARACADYPYAANQDNCDPPNRADAQNPAQGAYVTQSISRGVTTKIPVPFALRPHTAQYVDPASGAVTKLTVVPAEDAMSWNEGYGLYGTGEIDAIAGRNDPAHPMLVLFAHDGDNSWQGGYSYFHDNVSAFSHAAAAQGYRPTVVSQFLADHPADPNDVVHVEDGGWVNADGDFGSPQFINWNWPLVNAAGQFDIASGWAEDERNWAVLTAATNRVETLEDTQGPPNPARIADPTQAGTTALEKAWAFLLAGHESGYMYYGTALDFEIKASLAADRACELVDPLLAGGPDTTAPTVWLPQRLPWNPGGTGGGSLWHYPGGAGAAMTKDFWVWTFAYDVSGVDTVTLVWRVDLDGRDPIASTQNETYAGGPEVGPWQVAAMTRRAFPTGNALNDPNIDFSVLPTYIADEWSAHVTGLDSVLVDYYCEARDAHGRITRTPIQHVWIGSGGASASSPAVAWEPAAPVAGGTLTIHYDPVPGALPDTSRAVRIHVGHSGWTNVLSPDPLMTWNATTRRFDYSYAIPPTATSVDFVFQNGANVWDNNGGADWHVATTGAHAPAHVIDGTLDAGAVAVANCAGQSLYADYDGHWLYLAAPKASALDHFVFVARPESTSLAAAPWAKAGQVAGYTLMLANESSNGWSGFFDRAGAQPTAGLQKATGAVLEALVDVTQYFSPAPPALQVAFAGYGTADGGTLQSQVPCGNGDGTLAAAERTNVFSSAVLSVSPAARPAGPALRIASAMPAHDAFRAVVDAARGEPVRVQVLDVRGAVVATLYDAVAPGPLSLSASLRGEGRSAPAGIYFVTARTPRGSSTCRLVLVP